MAKVGEEPDLIAEARAIAASAAALVAEFVEEDITRFERMALPPHQPTTPSVPVPPAATTRPIATQPTTPTAPQSTKATSPAQKKSLVRPAVPQAGVIAHESRAVPWTDGPPPTLEEVRAHLGDCHRCELAAGRSKIVFGDGNPNADLMFIGEGPGEDEDRQGLPFVGRAGELLTQMIEKGLGLSRRDVYICNIVKCRPPKNRNPLPPEVHACQPYLDGQIRAVAPKVIVTLGKPAASLLLGQDIAITRVRGIWHDYRGIPLMPTLHPAYILRQYTAENRRAVWQDLKAALERSRT